MKYLVSGGAGFIGSHLVARLLSDGHKVIVVDDLSGGKMENLQIDHYNIEVHVRSILDDIGFIFKGVDVVFHLAALPKPQLSIVEPEPAHVINVNGTLKVLLMSRDKGVKRVVFASSASVYGEQEKYPSSEEAEVSPMSPYALHKLIGELYCQLFTRIYGLETNSLRFFNVYGTRMNPSGFYANLMPKFIKIIKSGKRPTINGDGEQVRDFVHVDDVVKAMILASKSKVFGETFNVGSGKNISVNDVFEIIREGLSKEIKPIHGKAVVEPRVTLADISKAGRLLGWKPKTYVKEGMKELL